MPIFRYFCLVGLSLLGALLLFDNPDKFLDEQAPSRWTSVDSLRAMAHLGEPAQRQPENPRFVWPQQTAAEPASHNPVVELAAQATPLIANAQASMDSSAVNARRATGQPAVVKPRKQKSVARRVRARTSVAENTQRNYPEFLQPPMW